MCSLQEVLNQNYLYCPGGYTIGAKPIAWVAQVDEFGEKPSLKVPKREIFVTELFTRSDPIWIGDMRTEPIKPFV